eukprot:3796863-Ditylum_brightwellii.AAC.1
MLTVKVEEVFQFTTICFESEDGNNNNLPSVWVCTATGSSSNEESVGDSSSIGTLLSTPSLDTNASNSSSDNDSVGNSFGWDNDYDENTKYESKEEE